MRQASVEREPTERVAFNVRFEEALRRQIAAAAKRSVRSLNSEIIYWLRASFENAA
jgi:predicted HicB family RNase H-like nuclease